MSYQFALKYIDHCQRYPGFDGVPSIGNEQPTKCNRVSRSHRPLCLNQSLSCTH